MPSLVFTDGLTIVTVAGAGAAGGATAVPVQALTNRLYTGQTLTFTGGHTATLTADAAVGDTALAVAALANALNAGDTAPAPVTLWNGKPAVAGRFGNWTPRTMPYGDSVERQSDHARTMIVYGTDYGAAFELAKIPVVLTNGERLVELADRLAAWLIQGGQCAVNTDDVEGHTYAACGILPGSTPQLALSDRRLLEYTLSLALVNLAANPTPMVCHYR